MSRLSSWLASPPPDAAVEIAPARVSVAVVGRHGAEMSVDAHASEPLAPGLVTPSVTAANVHDRAAVAAALRRAFEKAGVRPGRVALVIPDSAAKVSLVRFDQVPPRRDDLEQLIRLQARKATPFPIEEAAVSSSPGVRVGELGREFLVTVARRAIVAEYEEACQDAGAHAGIVDLATLSLVNMYLASPPVPPGDWLVVNVRGDSTSIVILRGADVIFHRHRAEGEQESLSDLVHQTSMYYQDRLEGTGFTRVLMAGTGRDAGAVEAARRDLEERLGSPAELVDPTPFARVADRVTVSPELAEALGPLVGISLRTLREGAAA